MSTRRQGHDRWVGWEVRKSTLLGNALRSAGQSSNDYGRSVGAPARLMTNARSAAANSELTLGASGTKTLRARGNAARASSKPSSLSPRHPSCPFLFPSDG